MALHKINGRNYFLNCDKLDITKTGNGKFDVIADGRGFTILGGRESGGAANEWFIFCPILFGDRWLPVGSKIEAIRAGLG